MPEGQSIRSGWRCDNCGELVSGLQAGWVEWLAAEDAKGMPTVSGLRLVHRNNTSPVELAPYGCQYSPRDEFKKNHSIVEGLALEIVLGSGRVALQSDTSDVSLRSFIPAASWVASAASGIVVDRKSTRLNSSH